MEYKSQKNVAGVDEVGRGSLIGPVYAAAVIFKKGFDKKKVKDSKKLSAKKREFLENYIKKNSYWAIGTASKKEIEKINILNASLLAMKRSILKLKFKPQTHANKPTRAAALRALVWREYPVCACPCLCVRGTHMHAHTYT